MNAFERLGLPATFRVDGATLEGNYLAKSRAVHPDFHANATADERAVMLAESAALNDAYATVREPLKRAEALLALHGVSSTVAPADQAFLMASMDLRERIDGGEASAVVAEIDAELASLTRRLGAGFDATPVDAAELGQVVAQVRTLNSLRREAVARR